MPISYHEADRVFVFAWICKKLVFSQRGSYHGVQSSMISVVNILVFLGLLFFFSVVPICDLVHDVEAMYGLP